MVLRSDDLRKSMESFKKFTAREILNLLRRENATTILDQLAFYKKAHRKEKSFQVWEEGYQPKLIQSEAMLKMKIDYIHYNPVKRGYVDKAIYWRYSSARDYEGRYGLIEIDRFW
jgi:REP element-mobilizing transposase RayT